MRKQSAIRRFLILLAFVVLPVAGILTVGMVKPCAAAACRCENCVLAIDDVGRALKEVRSWILAPALVEARNQLIAYFDVAATAFIKALRPTFPWTFRQLDEWFETFWYYNLFPAMQTMTDQLSVANIEQAHALGSIRDAAHLIHVQKALEDKALSDHRELRPADNVCVAGTVMGGMTRAAAFSRAYNAAAPAERAGRTGNEIGTPGAGGGSADTKDRWQTYIDRYCKKDYNNEKSGCDSDKPFADQDVDVAGMIFLKDTIDLKNSDTKRSIDDLITNLAEPFLKDPVIAGADQSDTGKAAILAGESYRAKRQTVYDSLYHVVARRAPGAENNDFLAAIRGETGDPLRTGAKPSRNEIMQAMIDERVRTGKYALRQIGEPENNRREAVIQQALQLMQMSDQLDLMDRYALMLAAQVSAQIKAAKPLGRAAASAPK